MNEWSVIALQHVIFREGRLLTRTVKLWIELSILQCFFFCDFIICILILIEGQKYYNKYLKLIFKVICN